MISLKQLAVFASIARHGGLGPAAEELFLSKGAVSQALAELERQLGSPLFDRVHPRLQLNDQGRQLQPLAEELLDRVQDIQALFQDDAAPQGLLRLGASQTIGNYLLPALLAKMPAATAQVRITNTHNLCAMLAHFELDLALVEGEVHHPALLTKDWLEDEMLVLARPGHPLAGQSRLPLEALAGQPWVLREVQSGSREQFDRELAPRVAPAQVLELNTLEAVMGAVEQGLGLTLVSKLAAAPRLQSGQLVQLGLAARFPRTLRLAWHRQKYHSTLLRRFVDFCLDQSPPAKAGQ
ncbi:LysR substrate-binding domain-containing protein [Gallaecimonas kandeliae]|uniref:LysR substrate-binding domain-containing protein n=1 Tax=Gallaecimonas kandeliae TaxID=3029055 RepID=UPI0026486E9F|nr:LysR substrate-binding domain-containing protein [Gallaecimonas kandeliae]WKE64788.1 LysR substrate-binding domain-containing protein [Gallaecimonas kandeliae]